MVMRVELEDMDDFTMSYIEGLIWSSEPNGADMENWEGAVLSNEATHRAYVECASFQYRFGCYIDSEKLGKAGGYSNRSMAGHDFAITRNGHGAGFWDGDWPTHGDILTRGSESFGEVELYLGDDGLLYS